MEGIEASQNALGQTKNLLGSRSPCKSFDFRTGLLEKRGQRKGAWFEKEEAASKVREPGLKALILNL